MSTVTLGRIVLLVRQKFRHGLRVAYYRDIVRRQILESAPVTEMDDGRCEMHVLTSSDDWLNLIWALKSFYRVSSPPCALCIHDDGSLSAEHIDTLAKHFPVARIVSRAQADNEVSPTLANYPRCRAFRETNHLALKIFDFRHYLKSKRMLLLDSDVLFFREPTELIRRIHDPVYSRNTVNRDIRSAYTVDAAAARSFVGVDLIEQFNSGLGVIQRASLNLDWIEEFLGMPGITTGHFWRIEQTLFALCSARYGVELLPPEYDVRLEKGINGTPARHYVGAIRHLFYSEGIRALVKQGIQRPDAT